MTNGQQLGLHTEKNYHKNSRQLEGGLSKNVEQRAQETKL